MLTKILKLPIHPRFWKFLGFVSSIVAFTCFALSPSFHDLFGRWNFFKSIIYSIISLIISTMMLFVQKYTRFSRSVMVKAHVGFLVMMLTSVCSIWQDRVSQNESQENGSSGIVLNMCSTGAFGLVSLSLSRQLELGFEVGLSNFLFGSFFVLLMKMNFKLAPLAVILCYMIINIRSFSDFSRKKLGLVHYNNTEQDLESGMNVAAEQFLHKNRLQEHAQRYRMPLPIYQSVNIGLEHAARYRSAVSFNGKSYTSENLFPNRRSSEQDVAKLALKHITTGIKDEGLSLILETPTSFKSKLNDYAKKMNLKIAYDDPVPQEGVAGGFKSSLTLNGEQYTGDTAKTKWEAEQSAACCAVLSNLESLLL